MRIIEVTREKHFYKWGLKEGEKVAGLYESFEGVDNYFQGKIEVEVQTTYYKINNTVYCNELISFPSGRVKKSIRKAWEEEEED